VPARIVVFAIVYAETAGSRRPDCDPTSLRDIAMSMMLLLLATMLATTAVMAYLPVPFLWIALLWATVFCVLAVRRQPVWRRVVWINLAAVLVVLGLAETYFHFRETERMAVSITEGYYADHQVLGYCPVPGRESRAIKYHGSKLVYDVRYRIDSRGLRVSPPAREPTACGRVLFFGGSVTFGEGVKDDQAMPYLTGVKTGGSYSVDNFGFHGYGPHQMLAALERGVVDELIKGPVRYVIYQGIPAHVARSAGRARWDRHGPKFVLDDRGQPVYAGAFDDGLSRPVRWLRKQLDKSAFYRWSGTLQREAAPDEIELYIAIVIAGRDAVAEKFPAAEFHVLLWGNPGEKTYDAIRAGLERGGVNVHPVSEILPGYSRNPSPYEISPYDRHPNPRAHEQIADYVSTRILQATPCQGAGPQVAAATS
jgi:hypothetical protein